MVGRPFYMSRYFFIQQLQGLEESVSRRVVHLNYFIPHVMILLPPDQVYPLLHAYALPTDTRVLHRGDLAPLLRFDVEPTLRSLILVAPLAV